MTVVVELAMNNDDTVRLRAAARVRGKSLEPGLSFLFSLSIAADGNGRRQQAKGRAQGEGAIYVAAPRDVNHARAESAPEWAPQTHG